MCLNKTKVYYRQNMYVMSAQWSDKQDLNKYLGPIIVITVTMYTHLYYIYQGVIFI